MSKTKFVSFGDQGFWAYDVGLGVFLKYLIDAAMASVYSAEPWLSDAVSSWRIDACIQDLGFTVDESWPPELRQTFLGLAEEACAELATRESIPAEEIVRWPILENEHIFPRGATEVATAPVVELGRAIIALVSGKLPAALKGQIWLYGAPEGRMTIGWEG